MTSALARTVPTSAALGQPRGGDRREAGHGVGPAAHVADLPDERRAAVDPDRHPSAELAVDDPAGCGDDAQLVVVALLRHAPGDARSWPRPRRRRSRSRTRRGLRTPHRRRRWPARALGPVGGGQLVEVADADERHGDVTVLLRCVADEQPRPQGRRDVLLRSWRRAQRSTSSGAGGAGGRPQAPRGHDPLVVGDRRGARSRRATRR